MLCCEPHASDEAGFPHFGSVFRSDALAVLKAGHGLNPSD